VSARATGPLKAQLPPLDAVRCTQAVPCLHYQDAPAAVAWLVEVLGADARHVYPGPDGTITHAELWFGDGCVMLGSFRGNGLPPTRTGESSVYLVIDTPASVEALYARAVAAGARIIHPLHDTAYASRDFGCADPEGNLWHFGTYAPATADALPPTEYP
jgi:uncharacterized glyoxalase superfamily protein PhnB